MKKPLKVSLYVIGCIILLPILLIGGFMIYVLLVPDSSNSNNSDDNVSNIWKIGHYVDSFDEPTGEKYIRGVFHGRFNNSATTNSPLTVEVYVDSDSTVTLRLWEYDSHLVKDKKGAIIIAKDGNGETYRVESRDIRDIDHDGVFSSPYNYQYPDDIFWHILDKGGIAHFLIYIGEYSKSDYKFSIDTQGLKEQIQNLSVSTNK